jgi:hypothetical protein
VEIDPDQPLDQRVKISVNTESGSSIYNPESESILIRVEGFKLVPLESVLAITNLGEFNHEPTDEELLIRTKELNPDLVINQVEIVVIDNGKKGKLYTIIPRSDDGVNPFKPSLIYGGGNGGAILTFEIK